MGWTVSVIFIAVGGAILVGCGGSARPSPADTNAYLNRLTDEQVKLAAAERRIPRRAGSPRALARSISLLAAAVTRLGRDLGAIRPPAVVASLHRQLIAIAGTYVARLRVAARLARTGGEQKAGAALITATNSSSGSFSATATKISHTLGR